MSKDSGTIRDRFKKNRIFRVSLLYYGVGPRSTTASPEVLPIRTVAA